MRYKSPMWLLALVFLAAAETREPGQGRASVDCRVTREGRLQDCRLVSEDPAGANVGAFALQLARNSRVAADDRRIRKGRIVLVFRMKLP
ncbi:MAG: hypothetical protein ACKN9P_09395 [Phenylobacterium sp.]